MNGKKIEWNKVTWYSKLAAVIFFIVIFPAWMFYMGWKFREAYSLPLQTSSQTETQSTNDTTPYNTFGYKMVTVEGTNSEFQFPMLTDYYDVAVRNKVNAQLKAKSEKMSCTYDMSREDLENALLFQGRYRDDLPVYSREQVQAMTEQKIISKLDWNYTSQVNVVKANSDIFSIEIKTDNFCGGAHPNYFDESITFDMQQGTEVKFTDLFANFDAHEQALANIIFPLRAADAAKPSPDQGADCESDDIVRTMQENLRYSTYVVKDTASLFVVPSLPHVITVCSNTVEVPISKLKGFIKTDGILGRF
jgi:hypothetical protein